MSTYHVKVNLLPHHKGVPLFVIGPCRAACGCCWAGFRFGFRFRRVWREWGAGR